MSTAILTRPTRVAAARPATPAARPQRPAGRVRLTRRGRVLVVLALAVALLAGLSLLRTSASVATSQAPAPAPLGVTTVHPGETLWGVARRIAPDADVRRLVAQIRELNHMDSATLQIGQQLLLPVPA